MKASMQNDIVSLGRMRVIGEMLENASATANNHIRNDLMNLTSDFNKILSKHWDKCNEFISDDDT